MATPVFLSVGGKVDSQYAQQVHAELGEALAYHYQITGEETANFRSEIEEKINLCSVFVVFWSSDYLKSEHACLELASFKKLFELGHDPDKSIIIVSREMGGPDIQGKWRNPINQKEEFILGKWRNERAIGLEADAKHVAQLIKRRLERIKIINDILIARGWLVDNFQQEISTQEYQAKELIFVSGLEGDGRRTSLRQFMRQNYAHRVERPVAFESIGGPDDFLISLMEAISIGKKERDEIFLLIEKKESTTKKEIRKILHRARDNKTYYVVAIDKFSGVDSVRVPIWLSDVLSVFGIGNAPLVFLVTSSPVTDDLLVHYPNSGRVRVPGLEEEEMKRLVHLLSQEDNDPKRWDADKKQLVAKISGSSPALCKIIMHNLAAERTLDFVAKIAQRDEDRFGQNISMLMGHWIAYYDSRISDIYALRVIEKLGVTSKEALDEILRPVIDAHGEIDLYTLRDQGLIEQLSDGIFRIPPLIQRRLGAVLWGKVKQSEIDRLFEGFSRKLLVAKTEYGAIYASNAVAVASRSSFQGLAPEYEKYLTLATLFKAGLDKYSNKDWNAAYNIFKRTMLKLKYSSDSVDITTQIEISRFFGLASARRGDAAGVKESVRFLSEKFTNTRRKRSALAMANFVNGFYLRVRKKFSDAIGLYKGALYLLKDERSVERQRAAVYTELSLSYLRITPPDFVNSLEMAKAAYSEKEVIHTLNSYVQALVFYSFRSGLFCNSLEISDELQLIESLLEKLRDRCADGDLSFHDDRKNEYLRERERWVSKNGGMNNGAGESDAGSGWESSIVEWDSL